MVPAANGRTQVSTHSLLSSLSAKSRSGKIDYATMRRSVIVFKRLITRRLVNLALLLGSAIAIATHWRLRVIRRKAQVIRSDREQARGACTALANHPFSPLRGDFRRRSWSRPRLYAPASLFAFRPSARETREAAPRSSLLVPPRIPPTTEAPLQRTLLNHIRLSRQLFRY